MRRLRCYADGLDITMRNRAKHIDRHNTKRHRIRVITLCGVIAVVIIAAVLFFFFTPILGYTNPADDEPLIIRIGQSEYDYPPLHYYENDQLVGFDVELAKAAAELTGAEIEFVPINWGNATDILVSGDVDVLWGGLERASLDERVVRYTKSYLRSNIVLLMPEGRDYSALEDLQGLSICALNFTPAFNYVQVYNRDVIKSRHSFTPPEYQSLLDALDSGECDCMITDTSFASFFLRCNNREVYSVSDTIIGSNYAVGVRMEDTVLFERLQDALDELQANGTIDRLREDWIGN